MTAETVTAGYLALRDHAAWLDLSSRGKIRVSGEDRARLLHAMTTNQVNDLKPGEGCYAFFLNAQGRILGDVNLFCFEDHFLLDTEPETRQKLFEHLDRYIIADDVTIEDETDHTCTISVEGPEATAVLAVLHGTAVPQGAAAFQGTPGFDGPVPERPYSTAVWNSTIVARLSSTGSDGYFLIAPMADKDVLVAKLSAAGVTAAAPEDARIVRLEHGRPRYGEEITERYLVQETGQLQAVDFHKGCYLGQEIVERVRSRAQIHRFLRHLEIESPQVPDPGATLKSGEAPAGEIASAVFSPALGKTVALAYVRTQFAEPGTELSLGNAPARVTA